MKTFIKIYTELNYFGFIFVFLVASYALFLACTTTDVLVSIGIITSCIMGAISLFKKNYVMAWLYFVAILIIIKI